MGTREMILKLIILTNFARSSLQLRAADCYDEQIGEQCFSFCRLVYRDCVSNCNALFCDSLCLVEFEKCEDACPCGKDCLSGCVECPQHPFCEDVVTTTTTTTTSMTTPNEPFATGWTSHVINWR